MIIVPQNMSFSIFGLLAIVAFLFTGTETQTCCQFDSSSGGDLCTGWNALGWYLYSDKTPSWDHTKKIITHSNDYEWTQNSNAAAITSTSFTGIGSGSTFTFQYYGDVTGTSSYMSVSFETTTGVVSTLAKFGDTSGVWNYYSIDCYHTLCCPAYPCEGSLVFTAYYPTGPPEYFLFAIDDVETGEGCGNPACCSLSNYDICGWIDESSAYAWIWSGSYSPSYLLPTFKPVDGSYVWFQLNGGVAANPSALLVSPPIANVNNAFNFSLDFYVEADPAISTNALYVYFQEDGGYDKVLLTMLYVTGTGWQSQMIHCSGQDSGSCCAAGPGSTCSGQVQFDPTRASGNVFFAGDNLVINAYCIQES